MLAPNSLLRAAAAVYGREVADDLGASAGFAAAPVAPVRYLWGMPLVELFEFLPLVCPYCGAVMGLIAFVSDAAPIERILNHIGQPPRPLRSLS